MSAYEFIVEQRQVPGKHEHFWVAIDKADGSVIDLPQGGTGQFLGRYPEIDTYLGGKNISTALEYTAGRGDSFDADHANGIYTWTFNTGGTVVVEDIARLIWGLSVRT